MAISYRLLVYALAPLLLAVAWWSARQATSARIRRSTGDLVAMLPGALPRLDPFRPASSIEQDLINLVYEPLLKVDTTGQIQPALATHWTWTQQVTCWFANADLATRAADHLRALDADRWIALGLNEVTSTGPELLLRFGAPSGPGPDLTLQEVTPFEPLPISFVRIRVKSRVRSGHEHFIANAVEKAHIRRAWFDGDQIAELVVCGHPGDAVEELRQHYQAQPDLNAEISILARVAALREPVLEFRLDPNRTWPDQSHVTAEDAMATVNHILRHDIPVPNQDAFRSIQALDAPAPDRLRITYRKFQGAALCGWMQLPIVPANWLEIHPEAQSEESAPGTGPFHPSLRRASTLILDAHPTSRTRISRIRLQSDATALTTQVAFATGVIDLFWPPLERLSQLRQDPRLSIHAAPPRSRLLVMWNLRNPVLSDPQVRKALALGIDRTALITELVHGAGSLHDGLFHPGLWFSQPPPPFAKDLAQAATLLDQAGWLKDITTGLRKKPDTPLRIELLTTSGNPQRERLAQLLAAQWRQLGIDTVITPLPWTELIATRLTPRRFDAAILGLDFETSWDQLPFWHSTQASPGGMNFSGLADPEVDLLLQALASEFDPAAVPARTRQLESRIASLHAFLPLFTDQQPAAIRRTALPPDLSTIPLTLRQWALAPPPAAPAPPPVEQRQPALQPPPASPE
jgi:ABC-type transport system substrate-binding protein